uniref:LIM domain 7 n=1 Tax=Myotis myotis TaxID=51298 RepID=A0A7J7Z417_MYOMY|nr:LIM domain 7 [Myotis myotis]
MRITEEAGQARSAQKLMGPFQVTRGELGAHMWRTGQQYKKLQTPSVTWRRKKKGQASPTL